MLPIARYRFHAVIVLTILAGIALSLVAQPPPATYAPGWSAPRALATVDLRDTRGISLSPDQSIHLVWSNTEDDALQVFSARMSLNGDWLARPQRISRAGTRSFSPALALLPDGGDLIAYIEKSPSAALMVSARGEPPRRAVDGAGDMRQLALAGNRQDTFAVWSEDRERQPAIYMARFNTRGDVVSGARRLSAEAALATQPALVVAGGALHVFYFTDDNRYVDLHYARYTLDGEPLDEPLILSHRAQLGSTAAYPVVVFTDAAGTIDLLEAIGGSARLSRFDANGSQIGAQPVVLDGIRNASALDARTQGDILWVSWSGLARRNSRPQVLARPFTLNGKPGGPETRLTFSTSGAFQPVWLTAGAGLYHLFWVENVSDRDAALFYASTAQMADLSIWERLGFAGSNPPATFVVTVATAFMYVLPLLIVNIWRVVIVSAVLLVAHRLTRANAIAMTVVLLAAQLPLYWPAQDIIGQSSLALNSASHWAFWVAATVPILLIARQWRRETSESLRWVALAFIWAYLYYWMNAIALLREAYAP